MEKINIINSRNKNIVGNMTIIKSIKIVVLAHGFTNDKSSMLSNELLPIQTTN